MTPRTLWTFILKIIGIYFLMQLLVLIPQSIGTVIVIGQTYCPQWYGSFLVALALVVLVVVLYIIVVRLFLFKTDFFIDKLKLDKNFTEEKIEINIHQSTVLQIAAIIVGGLLFTDGLPSLCKEIIVFFQQKVGLNQTPTAYYLVLYSVKIITGYLMLTNSKRLVNWIELRRRK